MSKLRWHPSDSDETATVTYALMTIENNTEQ